MCYVEVDKIKWFNSNCENLSFTFFNKENLGLSFVSHYLNSFNSESKCLWTKHCNWVFNCFEYE